MALCLCIIFFFFDFFCMCLCDAGWDIAAADTIEPESLRRRAVAWVERGVGADWAVPRRSPDATTAAPVKAKTRIHSSIIIEIRFSPGSDIRAPPCEPRYSILRHEIVAAAFVAGYGAANRALMATGVDGDAMISCLRFMLVFHASGSFERSALEASRIESVCLRC
jgi:hypothetical protein